MTTPGESAFIHAVEFVDMWDNRNYFKMDSLRAEAMDASKALLTFALMKGEDDA